MLQLNTNIQNQNIKTEKEYCITTLIPSSMSYNRYISSTPVESLLLDVLLDYLLK